MVKKILYMALLLFSAYAIAQQALQSGSQVSVEDVIFCRNHADSRALLSAMESGGFNGFMEEFQTIQDRDRENNTVSCAIPPSPVDVVILEQVESVAVADTRNPGQKVMWYVVAVKMEGSLYYIITRRSVIPYSTPKGYYRLT